MNRKHLFLLALAILCLIGVLQAQGCASEYQWYAYGPASKAHQWVVIEKRQLYDVCGQPQTMSNLGGCASQMGNGKCFIYSWMTEEEAKRAMSGDGITLWEHEMKHCGLTDGIAWRHQ